MLTNAWLVRLDKKGRLVIPAPLRAKLGLMLAFSPGIPTLPGGHWSLIVTSSETFRKTARENYHRLAWWQLCGSLAWEDVPDENTGRVLIPHLVRELCGLAPQEAAVVRGMGEAAQIISETTWRAEMRVLLQTQESVR